MKQTELWDRLWRETKVIRASPAALRRHCGSSGLLRGCPAITSSTKTLSSTGWKRNCPCQ